MVSFRFSAAVLSLIVMMSVISSSVYAVEVSGEEDAAAVDTSSLGRRRDFQEEVEEHLLDFVDGIEVDVDVVESIEEDVMSDGTSSSALVVDGDHHEVDADADDNSQRRLTYSYYYNNHKACRRYDGSNGYSPKHYDVYTIYNDWKKCEEYCNSRSWCYAYEYSDYKRCELWKEKPAKLSGYKKNFYCSIKKKYDKPKEPTPYPTPYPTNKKPYPTPYKKPTGSTGKWAYYNGACRTKDGGAGYKNTHWYLYKHYKESDCQKKCYDYGKTCKAYEYSYGRCEIWHQDPGYYTYKDGYKCVLRKF